MKGTARRASAEAVGTFFLVFIGTGAAAVDASTGGAVGHVGVSLAFAFVVLAVVYAIGHVSGAHINPAVTVGFWSVGRFPTGEALAYGVAQCTGAVVASLTLGAVLPEPGGLGATVPALAAGPAFVVEALLTFLLMFVIMAVATDGRVSGAAAGLAIGLTVGCDALAGGPLTGASMNPARSLGPAVAGGVWNLHWLYWAAPISGAVAAARAYELLRPAAPPGAPPPDAPLGVEGPIEGT